jgi:hypothetical protein
MSRKNKKLPADFTPDEALASRILQSIPEKAITCADAFALAGELNLTKKDLGLYADYLAIDLRKCQIGLFGNGTGTGKKKLIETLDRLDPALEAAVKESARDNIISCAAVFDIAARLNMDKVAVGSTCQTLGIKIKGCRFGAF